MYTMPIRLSTGDNCTHKFSKFLKLHAEIKSTTVETTVIDLNKV
jgi:hypothetical protein